MKHKENEIRSSGHHIDRDFRAHSCQHEHEQKTPDAASTELNANEARGLAYLIVPGMGSDHCAGLISTSINRLPGIYNISTNIGTHKVPVYFDRQSCSTDIIKQAVIKADYEVASTQRGGAKRNVDTRVRRSLSRVHVTNAGVDTQIYNR